MSGGQQTAKPAAGRPLNGLGGIVSWRDVEVKHFLANAQLSVQGDRGIVSIVSLYEDYVDASCRSQTLEFLNHGCGHTPPSVSLIDRQIIDVELRPCLLELWQHVACQAPDHLRSRESRYGDESLAFQ